MAVDASTGRELAEAMTVLSAEAVIDPAGNSISQPSVNIDHLRRYDYDISWCLKLSFVMYEY